MEMMPWSVQNGILIDIIGSLNGGTNFSIDETIRRKATVTAPSTTFNKATQWDVFALDTCNNLEVVFAKEPKLLLMFFDAIIYPNPSNGTFTINNSNQNVYRSLLDNRSENFQCRKHYQI
jgi:hypothetical protein